MGIFSKMFGGDKMELTDDVQESSVDEQANDETTENKEPSPFLVDDEDDVKTD